MQVYDPDIKVYDPDELKVYDPDMKTAGWGKAISTVADDLKDYGSRVMERGKQVAQSGVEGLKQIPEILPSVLGARSWEDLGEAGSKALQAVASPFTPLFMAGVPLGEAVRKPATTVGGERVGEAIAGGVEMLPALAAGQPLTRKAFEPVSVGRNIGDIPISEWSTKELPAPKTTQPISPKEPIPSIGETPTVSEAGNPVGVWYKSKVADNIPATLELKKTFNTTEEANNWIIKQGKLGANKKLYVVRDVPSKPAVSETIPPKGETGEAGGLRYGQELPKYAAGRTPINLERIDSPYSVRKTINDIADFYNQKKTTRTWEEIQTEANSVGLDIKNAIKDKPSNVSQESWIQAKRDLLNDSATRLRALQESLVGKEITEETMAQIRLTMDHHAGIQAEVMGLSSEAGRTLNIHKKLSQAKTSVEGYKKIIDALGGKELNKEIVDKFLSIDPTDTLAVNKFVRQVTKAKTSDMVFEAWINALLSGPQTHIVNTTSNLATFLFKPIESLTSATLELGKQVLTGKPRERFFGESKAEIVGAVRGIKEGVRTGLKTYLTEMPSDISSKLDTIKYQTIPSKTFKIKGKEFDVGGKQIRIPSRLLMAADDVFKAIVYRAEINSEAYRIASKGGLRGKSRLERMAELVNNPTDKMIEIAHKEAQYRTYTQPLGKIGNRLMSIRNDAPGLKYIIPFLRTPTNIAKFGLERTPLNFIRLAYKRGRGELRGAEFFDELSKPILGSLIGAGVVVMAGEGLITGGGPKDKTQRNTLYQSGWQPYSIKIGDTYYGYNRTEPLAAIMGMASDFTELVTDKDREEMASKIALSISKNLTSKTFMQGLTNALDAVSDPDRYGKQWLKQVAGSLIPSLSANIARAKDEKLRVTETPIETIKSRIPIISESLLPKRDLWGREISKTGTTSTRLLSPLAISRESKDKLDKEMVRLMKLGDFKISMPTRKIMGIELSNQEYDDYVKISGERAKTILNKHVNNAKWDKLPDESKANIIKTTVENQRDYAKKIILQPMDKNKVHEQLIRNKQLLKSTY